MQQGLQKKTLIYNFNIFTGQGSNLVDNLHSSHCVAVKVNNDGTLYQITYPQLCTKSLPTLCEKSTRGMTCIFLYTVAVDTAHKKSKGKCSTFTAKIF